MKPLRTLSLRTETLVDQYGLFIADPTDRSVLGFNPPLPGERMVYALQLDTQSGLTRRYIPSLAANEKSVFGIDYSDVIPLGVGIAAGTLDVFTNTVPPQDTTLLTMTAVTVRQRALYATITAKPGADGADFRLLWQATDTLGNIWPRTVLCLCSATA